MSADELGLFDLPDRERTAPPRKAQRGRNRETWTRTATAEVTIVDAVAVCEAAALAKERYVTIRLDVADDIEPLEAEEPLTPVSDEALDALTWLLWPTAGLEEAVEADALRILSMDSEVAAEASDRGTVTWTVTVKLADVEALRRLACEVHPGDALKIEESLAVAWACTADPFAPLRSIAGITLLPGPVEVRHQFRRT